METPLLEIRDVKKYFPVKKVHGKEITVKAVDSINLKINQGEIVGLVGESGCGKSTLGKSILKLHEITGGQILFHGEDITNYNERQMRPLREKIQIIFQDPYASLNPKKKIVQSVMAPLDVSVRSQVLNLLKDLHKERNLTYIFISHDLSVVEYLCDKVAVMYLGRIMEYAGKRELYGKPLHPYTKALLSAIPVPDIHAKRDEVILQGELPSPLNPPAGCLFSTRCPMATEKCRQSRPELTEITGDDGTKRSVACFLYQ